MLWSAEHLQEGSPVCARLCLGFKWGAYFTQAPPSSGHNPLKEKKDTNRHGRGWIHARLWLKESQEKIVVQADKILTIWTDEYYNSIQEEWHELIETMKVSLLLRFKTKQHGIVEFVHQDTRKLWTQKVHQESNSIWNAIDYANSHCVEGALGLEWEQSWISIPFII